MDTARLVRMANDIAQFFASESAPADAAQQVAAHLTKFWDPRMRREIIQHLRGGGAGLSALARDAVGLLVMPAADKATP